MAEKKTDKDNSDVMGMNYRRANKISIKRLSKAKKILDLGKSKEFYD